jgi:hypothetical protein
MTDLEIGETGDVSVPDELKGTWADRTLPLPERLELLIVVPEMCLMSSARVASLLNEALDHLKPARDVAMRRGRQMQTIQEQLHRARQEVMFLRQYIREEIGKDPEFFQQMPVG